MIELDAVMIVAHPDDDGLFGGALQKRLRFLKWGIVCLTYSLDHQRGQELVSWQNSLGTPTATIQFLNFPDDPSDLLRKESSFSVALIKDALNALDIRAKLVVTHNSLGEYGHPHHTDLHQAVVASFINPVFFGTGSRKSNVVIDVEDFSDDLCSFYPSQSTVVRTTHEQFGCCRTAGYIFP